MVVQLYPLTTLSMHTTITAIDLSHTQIFLLPCGAIKFPYVRNILLASVFKTFVLSTIIEETYSVDQKLILLRVHSAIVFKAKIYSKTFSALHCHWTAIATKPIGQCVPDQTRGVLHEPEEQSRPRGGTSIGITDQPQYPRL